MDMRTGSRVELKSSSSLFLETKNPDCGNTGEFCVSKIVNYNYRQLWATADCR